MRLLHLLPWTLLTLPMSVGCSASEDPERGVGGGTGGSQATTGGANAAGNAGGTGNGDNGAGVGAGKGPTGAKSLSELGLPFSAEDIVTLTDSESAPNGVWSWFEDERAIVDQEAPDGPLLLASSVSAGSGGEAGDVDVLWLNLQTGDKGDYELHDQLEQDDHNSAALYLREDGRYLAMYSYHGTNNFSRWRISTEPHDPTDWQEEKRLNHSLPTTYSNIYRAQVGGEPRLFSFIRSKGWDPNVLVSSDDGTTWSYHARFIDAGNPIFRPYVKYKGDSEGNIHAFYTDQHPRNYDNNIYHARIFDGAVFDSSGTKIDDLDNTGMPVTAGTRLFEGGPNDVGWVVDLELDQDGNPYGAFSVQRDPNGQDHRYYYARHDGSQWKVNEMAYAGTRLYPEESDYTGLVALDPHDPNCVYISADVDPATGEDLVSEADGQRHYELFTGHTSDGGESWTWTPLTTSSTVDNLRPIMPEWDGEHRVLLWLRGRYSTYTEWDTEVVSVAWRGGCGD